MAEINGHAALALALNKAGEVFGSCGVPFWCSLFKRCC